MKRNRCKNFLAINLLRLRRNKKMSRFGLCNELEVLYGIKLSISSYQNYEANLSEPTIFVFSKLAEYFKVSMEDLYYKNLTTN